MGFLVSLALGWKWPGWAARLFGWAAPVLVALAVACTMVGLIYRTGKTAGGAKVAVQAEQAHAKAVATARADERHAQATVDAIGKRVAAADDQSTALVRSKITEIHNAIDSTPGTGASVVAPPAVFDTAGVRASLNAVVDDANRSADIADAER